MGCSLKQLTSTTTSQRVLLVTLDMTRSLTMPNKASGAMFATDKLINAEMRGYNIHHNLNTFTNVIYNP